MIGLRSSGGHDVESPAVGEIIGPIIDDIAGSHCDDSTAVARRRADLGLVTGIQPA